MLRFVARMPVATSLAVLLHVIIIAALLLSFSWDRKKDGASMTAGVNQPIVEAVSVEQSVLEQHIERLRSQEEARKRELQQADERARQAHAARLEEEARLKAAQLEKERVRQEAEKERQRLEALRQEQAQAEQRRQQAEEEAARKMAEAQAIEERARQQEEEARRAAEEERAKAEQERRKAEEERRKAETERRQAEEERRRAEEERRKVEEERRKAEEEQRRAEEARRQAELQAQRRREAEARAAAEAELQRRLEAERASQLARARNEYIAAIRSRVTRNWARPTGVQQGWECEVTVTQMPGGQVLRVDVGRCQGDDLFRESVIRAVERSSPLPDPPLPEVFEREIQFTFRVE